MKIHMRDLEKAKELLEKNNLTLSIVKNGKIIFESSSHGIGGFLTAIKKLDNQLEDASVADKIAGKAIALLCAYSKVQNVYALILSRSAKLLFEEYAVHCEWDQLVENILDATGEDACPFEKLAKKISDPNEAYRKFKALQTSLNIVDEDR